MKVFIVLVGALLLLAAEESGAQYQWKEEVYTLSSLKPSQTVTVTANSTEFIFDVAQETKKLYGDTNYTINIYIESLHCQTNNTDKDPSYPIIEVISKEISLPRWSRCLNINKEDKFTFEFNNGENFGADKIRIKPFGGKWSAGTGDLNVNAVFRAELKITQQVGLRDDVPQLDFHVSPAIEYEISMPKESKFCAQEGYSCAIALSVLSMSCFDPTYNDSLGLQVNTKQRDGSLESKVWCENTSHKDSYHETISSFDTLKFQMIGNATKIWGSTVVAVVTANLYLYSTNKPHCPEEYFQCQNTFMENTINCIPDDWKCDGRYNCPNVYGQDEANNECETFYFGYWSYSYSGWSLVWMLLFFVLMIATAVIVMKTVRFLCIRKRENTRRPRVATTAPEKEDLPPSYFQAVDA